MKGNKFPSLNRVLMTPLISLAMILLAASAFGQAQATGADLTGNVVDPNGAVVNGATVTANNRAGGITRTTTTGTDGTYKFINLPPGEGGEFQKDHHLARQADRRAECGAYHQT